MMGGGGGTAGEYEKAADRALCCREGGTYTVDVDLHGGVVTQQLELELEYETLVNVSKEQSCWRRKLIIV